jgi:uncharacterized tellurite resistance protein B-like protein
MLSTITSFFNQHLGRKSEGEDESTVDKFQLASAALLIELCKADQTIDEAETATLLKILKEKFSLPEEALNELMQLAQQEADEAISVYQFTSLINDEYSYSEKTRLLQNMWEVAFADGNLDRYEEHLIRKVAELMYITHSDFIKTKINVKNNQ